MGRHSGKSGGAASSGRAPRKAPRAVRWLSQLSGEALTAWGTWLIVAGGIVTVFTLWGILLIVIGVIMGALGLDLAA
jgi:hypothetical protein